MFRTVVTAALVLHSLQLGQCGMTLGQYATACVGGTATLCSLLLAEEGSKVESALNTLFQRLPANIKRDTIPGKMKNKPLPCGLGYFCFNDGTISGLKSVRKTGEALVSGTSPIKLSVPFTFDRLVFHYNKCGYQNLGIKFKVKCKVTLQNYNFQLDVVINNPAGVRDFVSGVYNKKCFLAISDLRFETLKHFNLELWNRDDTPATYKQELARAVLFTITDLIKSKLNRKIRVVLYQALREPRSYYCRDRSLEEMVFSKYSAYMRTPKPFPGKRFTELCTDEKVSKRYGSYDSISTLFRKRITFFPWPHDSMCPPMVLADIDIPIE